MQNPSKDTDGNFSSCKKKLALEIPPPAQLEGQALSKVVWLYRKQECLQHTLSPQPNMPGAI